MGVFGPTKRMQMFVLQPPKTRLLMRVLGRMSVLLMHALGPMISASDSVTAVELDSHSLGSLLAVATRLVHGKFLGLLTTVT